jgi:hypothetical protein
LNFLKFTSDEIKEHLACSELACNTSSQTKNANLKELADKLDEEHRELVHKFDSIQKGQEYLYGEIKEEVDNIKMSLMKDQVYLLYLCSKEARNINYKVSSLNDQSGIVEQTTDVQSLHELNQQMNRQNETELAEKLKESEDN